LILSDVMCQMMNVCRSIFYAWKNAPISAKATQDKVLAGLIKTSCKTPEMVEKEIAVNFLAYTIIRGNMAQAAILHNKTPRKLSFKSTLQIII